MLIASCCLKPAESENKSLFWLFDSSYILKHRLNTATSLHTVLQFVNRHSARFSLNKTLTAYINTISIKGTALNWSKSYFSDWFQFVQINDESSVCTKVNHGVPQGSVLGPILFSLYMLPRGNIIRTHSVNFHCYADDTLLYLSIKPEQCNQLTKLQPCLKDIKTWMTRNFLLLNSDKTEVLILDPKHLRDKLSNDIAALDDIALASNETVRNLGVIFDSDLSFNSQLKLISRTAFVTSRLYYYCNSLLSGSSSKSLKTLQLVQNSAARVLTRTKKRDHISPVLASLHWLPVKSRIELKVLLLTFKAVNNMAPLYLKELIVPYQPTRALRSQNSGLLIIHKVS